MQHTLNQHDQVMNNVLLRILISSTNTKTNTKNTSSYLKVVSVKQDLSSIVFENERFHSFVTSASGKYQKKYPFSTEYHKT
jgi:hypothetical protein